MIPVGSVDMAVPDGSAVLRDSWAIESLVDCIEEASGKTEDWCRNASRLSVKNYEDHWSVESFRRKMGELIRDVGAG